MIEYVSSLVLSVAGGRGFGAARRDGRMRPEPAMRHKPTIKPNYSRAGGGTRRSANPRARPSNEMCGKKKPLRKTEISFEWTSSLGTVKMRREPGISCPQLFLIPEPSDLMLKGDKSDSSIAATRWLVILRAPALVLCVNRRLRCSRPPSPSRLSEAAAAIVA